MRNSLFYFLMLTVILVGCYERTSEAEIKRFEKELGQKTSLALTQVIEDFDKRIQNQYPDLSLKDAYEKYLNFIVDSSYQLSSRTVFLSQLRKDSIFNCYDDRLVEEIWMKPDSVWIYKDLLFESYRGNKNPKGKKIWNRITNYDSLIYFKQNTGSFDYQGKYLKAIQSISNSNEIAKWYYDTKTAAGTISPHISAQLFLNSRVELDDYLVKQIIVIETYMFIY